MPFVFTKISDHGTSHPVVARLQLQTLNLLQASSLSQQKRGKVLDLAVTASMRLLRCWEVASKIKADRDRLIIEHHPMLDAGSMEIPHIVGLEHDAETFLYEAKNYVRDLIPIINVFLEKDYKAEASKLCSLSGNGPGHIEKDLSKFFPNDSKILGVIKGHQAWLSEIIRMRNAREHPGDKSGTLHIHNFTLMPDGKIRLPCWHRDDQDPSFLVQEMEALCTYMLIFGEDIIARLIEKDMHPAIMIIEIPDDKRDIEAPVRLQATTTIPLPR